MCKNYNLVRLPIPPPLQGGFTIFRCNNPLGLQNYVQATYNKAMLTLSQLTTLASAHINKIYSSHKLC